MIDDKKAKEKNHSVEKDAFVVHRDSISNNLSKFLTIVRDQFDKNIRVYSWHVANMKDPIVNQRSFVLDKLIFLFDEKLMLDEMEEQNEHRDLSDAQMFHYCNRESILVHLNN